MSYEYAIYLPNKHPLTFDALYHMVADALKNIEQPPKLTLGDKFLVIQQQNWAMRILWDDAAHVLKEAIEIAERYSQNTALKNSLVTCDRRITTDADDDFDMAYFNESIFVLEVLNTIENVIRVDFDGNIVKQFGDYPL